MPDRSIKVNIRADNDKANRALKETGDRIRGVGNQSEKTSQKTQRGRKSFSDYSVAGTSLGLVFDQLKSPVTLLTVGIGGIATAAIASIKSFSELETAVAEVSTLIEGTPAEIDGVYNSLQQLAVGYGTDQVEAARAYYQVVSAGASAGAEAQGILDAAVKASIGGVTDITTAADGLTSVLNAYGLAGSEAGTISDKFFQTVRAGKTTFEELSSSLGKVTPLAAAAGVEFDEVAGAVSTLTLAGVSTSEATTQLRAAMQGIIKPTKEAQQVAEELGIEFNQAALEQKGFQGVLQEVVEVTGGSISEMGRLFTSIEALQAVSVLAKNDTQDFSAAIEGVRNSAGSTEQAVDKMSNTVAIQFGRVSATSKAVVIGFGRLLSEALSLSEVGNFLANALANVGEELGLLDASVLNTDQHMDDISFAFTGARDAIARMANHMVDEAIPTVDRWNDSITENIRELAKTEEGTERLRAKQKELADRVFELGVIENRREEALKQNFLNQFNRIQRELDAFAKAEAEAEKRAAAEQQRILEERRASEEAFEERQKQDARKRADALALQMAEDALLRIEKERITVVARLADELDPLARAEREFARQVEAVNETVMEGHPLFERKNELLELLERNLETARGKLNETSTATLELNESTAEYLKTIDTQQAELDPLTQQLEDFRRTLRNLDDDYHAGLISIDDYKRASRELKAEIKGLEEQSTLTSKAAGVLDTVFKEIGNTLKGELIGALRDLVQAENEIARVAGNLGSAIGGAIGGEIGAAIGGSIGTFLGNLTGGDNQDRVTIGVNATGASHGALDVRSQRAASGLLLTAQSRRAGSEGRESSLQLLDQFIAIDEALVDLFARFGETVDFANTQLRPDIDLSTRLRGRGGDLHAQFGSVEFDEVNQASLDNAANQFIEAWIDALEGTLPEELQGLENIETLSQLESFITALDQSEIDAVNAELEILSERLTSVRNDLSSLDALTDSFDSLFNVNIRTAQTVREAVQAQDNLYTSYLTQTDQIYSLVDAGLDSVDALTTLEMALVSQKRSAVDLVGQYLALQNASSNALGVTADQLRDSLLSPIELLSKRFTELFSAQREILDSESPEQVQAALQSISRLTGDIVNLAGRIDTDDLTLADRAQIANLFAALGDTAPRFNEDGGISFEEHLARFIDSVDEDVSRLSQTRIEEIEARERELADATQETVQLSIEELTTYLISEEIKLAERQEIVIARQEALIAREEGTATTNNDAAGAQLDAAATNLDASRSLEATAEALQNALLNQSGDVGLDVEVTDSEVNS